MAKRFTDTTKWDDDWYLSLPPKMKLAWNYLCDTCDGAGVAKISFGLISYRIGEEVTRDDFNLHFEERIIWINSEQIWISGFLGFQYKTLKVNNHAHRGIMKRLLDLVDDLPLNDSQMTLINGWKESLQTLKEEDIGRGLDNSLKGEFEGKKFRPDLKAIYARYPRKEGKSKGLKRLEATITTPIDEQDAMKALAAFLAHHKRKGTGADFIPLFSTWTSSWRDWLDPNHGHADSFAGSATLTAADLPDYGEGA